MFDGSRLPLRERFKRRVLRMDAWKPYFMFPLAPRNKAGSIYRLWGDLPKGMC